MQREEIVALIHSVSEAINNVIEARSNLGKISNSSFGADAVYKGIIKQRGLRGKRGHLIGIKLDA